MPCLTFELQTRRQWCQEYDHRKFLISFFTIGRFCATAVSWRKTSVFGGENSDKRYQRAHTIATLSSLCARSAKCASKGAIAKFIFDFLPPAVFAQSSRLGRSARDSLLAHPVCAEEYRHLPIAKRDYLYLSRRGFHSVIVGKVIFAKFPQVIDLVLENFTIESQTCVIALGIIREPDMCTESVRVSRIRPVDPLDLSWNPSVAIGSLNYQRLMKVWVVI